MKLVLFFIFSDGSPNPVANSKLADAVEIAKKHNMPKTSIDKVIERSKVTKSLQR